MEKVFGFFGGDRQAGTSMVAQAFAETIAAKGRKVLFVSGSGNYRDLFIRPMPEHSIDDLKASIRSGRVQRDEVIQTLEKRKELWIMPGVRNTFLAKYFPENTYQIMLESLKEDFEYVVIDGGSDAQMGITVSALNYCDYRFFIITQQEKGLMRYRQYQKQILQPLGISAGLIINKYIRDPTLYLKTDIEKITEQRYAAIIPYVEYGWQAEMEGKTLLKFKPFKKAIQQLAETYVPSERRRKNGKHILFRVLSAK